jgi:3-hydroxymyristoyl/3-hydroxydecanoyl-(acyl carrier protein) dehydratase
MVVAPGLSPEHLRAELRRWLDPVVIPRRLRLCDALPREANGTLPRRRLQEAFEAPKPRVETLACRPLSAADADTNTAVFAVQVPRDLYSLRGHFRGQPIVPGVVQLELARSWALLRWPELVGRRLERVLRLKFLRPLRPGEQLRLELVSLAGGRVDFRMLDHLDHDSMISTGTLMFADDGG